MKDELKRKYDGNPVDLVIALDNPALDMLLQYRTDFVPPRADRVRRGE